MKFANKVNLSDIDAADFLQVSVHTLRKWRYLGRGPRYVKLGGAMRAGRGQAGRVLYRVVDLVDFLEANVVGTDDQPPEANRR